VGSVLQMCVEMCFLKAFELLQGFLDYADSFKTKDNIKKLKNVDSKDEIDGFGLVSGFENLEIFVMISRLLEHLCSYL
jgi:hypothetical protein